MRDRQRRDQPGDRGAAAHRRADRRGGGRRRGGTREGGTTGLGTLAPAERAAALRAFAATVDAHVDELAELEVANSGHPIGNARVGGRPRPRRAAVLLRDPGAVVRQADSGRGRPRRHVQRAARRRRRDHAVELPDDDRVVGLRARAGRRQRGAGEAGGVDAADHDPPRRARARGRAARGPVPGAARQGLGGGGAVRHPPRCAQDRVHRVDRGRQAGDGRRAPRRSSGSPSNSAARAPTSCSTTATSRRPRRPHRTACSTTPARTAARAAASSCSAASTTGSWSCSSRPSRASSSATRRRESTEMGPLVSQAAPGHGGVLRARRRAGRVPRQRARRARASGSRRPC